MTRLIPFLVIALGLVSNSSYCQTLDWAISMGGSSAELAHVVKTDSKNNVCVAGWHRGTVDFNPGSGTNNITVIGKQNLYIAKYEPGGKYIWAIGLKGRWGDITDMVLDANDNIYITGWIEGTADFDPSSSVFNITPVGAWDCFLAKYNSNGVLQWAFKIGSTYRDIGDGLTVDASNNIYLTGALGGAADFNPGNGTSVLTSRGSYDAFVAKYSSSGTHIWSVQSGGSGEDFGRDISLANNGDVIATGYFSANAKFNTSGSSINITAKGGTDIFLTKYDQNSGALIWAKAIGSLADDRGNAVAVDGSNNVLISGEYSGTADFNPSSATNNLTNSGSTDFFIAKYSSSGNYLWANGFGSTGKDESTDLIVNSSNEIFVTGRFEQSVDFDPSNNSLLRRSNGLGDFYIAQYSSSGKYLWAQSFGSKDDDLCHSLHYSANKLYSAGYFMNTVDFDPGTKVYNRISSGSNDIFVQKFSFCQDLKRTEIRYFCKGSQYTFPDGTTSSTPQTHNSRISNPLGCDSLITTILKFGKTSNTIKTAICHGDTLNLPDGKKAWSTGKYTSILPNSKGCDSTIYIDLKINDAIITFDTNSICSGDSIRLPDGRWTNGPGNFSSSFLSAAGCDSTVKTHVKTRVLNNTISVLNQTLKSNQAKAKYEWYDCTSKLLVDTNQSFIPSQSGLYMLVITIGNCKDSSECVDIAIEDEQSPLNIGNAKQFNSIQVYPNPVKNKLQISSNLTNYKIVVTSSIGKTVYSADEPQDFVNFSDWSNGIYFVTIISNEQFKTFKILK